MADIPVLRVLIPTSARSLQAPFYSSAQIEGALDSIFAVDRQLIQDGTYFVAETVGTIVACGGWSYRKTLCGGEEAEGRRENTVLDAGRNAARIRAFFVHPDWNRQGLGSGILKTCEEALLAAGFHRSEILATLAGEAFYARHGYRVESRYTLDLPNRKKLPVVRMLKEFSAIPEKSSV